MLEALEALLRRRLPPARTPWERGERRVLALIGPTGVGKTTTIAKIAARALLESRLKVSLITVDTYRIGATEHLGRYGEIMGAPHARGARRGDARRGDRPLVATPT